ncbi:MAG: nucleoside 2-deoxyribosyltransferase [Bacteroidales bacterium]|nr:nucleoside 2-deoxyribosyltransferase [Bacteroidales bacterium]
MKNKVYLAGGFSGWREDVKELTNIECFDPESKPDKHWSEYGTWDIHFIKQCDICFAYLDKNNPSGYGLAAEIGYAKALNKTVILIIEPGHKKDKYFQFLKQFADVVYESLYEGIVFLKTF